MDEKFKMLVQAKSMIDGYLMFRDESDGDFPLDMKKNLDTLMVVRYAICKILFLKRVEYYLSLKTGDLYLVNWIQNRPEGEEWVKISDALYHRIYEKVRGIRPITERFKG